MLSMKKEPHSRSRQQCWRRLCSFIWMKSSSSLPTKPRLLWNGSVVLIFQTLSERPRAPWHHERWPPFQLKKLLQYQPLQGPTSGRKANLCPIKINLEDKAHSCSTDEHCFLSLLPSAWPLERTWNSVQCPPIPAVTGWVVGIHHRTHTHTHPHTSETLINPLFMCLDCGREGTGDNPHRHWENMQTPHIIYSVQYDTDEARGGIRIQWGNSRCIFKSFFFLDFIECWIHSHPLTSWTGSGYVKIHSQCFSHWFAQEYLFISY